MISLQQHQLRADMPVGSAQHEPLSNFTDSKILLDTYSNVWIIWMFLGMQWVWVADFCYLNEIVTLQVVILALL